MRKWLWAGVLALTLLAVLPAAEAAGSGLTPEGAAACEKRVTIPMRGRAESLNAAASAAILLWELCRA